MVQLSGVAGINQLFQESFMGVIGTVDTAEIKFG